MTEQDYRQQRREMVQRQIEARGVRSQAVLDAMRTVRREGFVPSYLGEFAYDDTALPIEEEQTISQPFIVAFMVEALELEGDERVLEIGTGSGYAAAVLAEVAREVYTIERHEGLARTAASRLAEEGYAQVHVRCGDGTLGWPEAAPFDAIVVAAGGPRVPDSLREQLAIGGRLVIPVGEQVGLQSLRRIRRVSETEYEEEDLGGVRFVPLIGEEGFGAEPSRPRVAALRPATLSERLAKEAEQFGGVADAPLDALLERIGDARIVLLGEATHGTAEFYGMRDRITRALVERKGFDVVAVEADWPDAARIDHYVRDLDVPPLEWRAFARFPTWMWRNVEFQRLVDWLHDYNSSRSAEHRVRFAGLDLYSLYTSIDEVLRFLDERDPQTAGIARQRYGCLTPWQSDPAAYGRAVLSEGYRSCEGEVVGMLRELMARRARLLDDDPDPFFDAAQNARLVADAERYYRIMYYGHHESWNLRDTHMFETLKALRAHHGPDSRIVVWEHNSHVGDARATEMSARGELNVGELCRRELGDELYAIGFGTDHGSVAAASYWDGPMEVKTVRPAREDSYESVFHESGVPGLLLGFRTAPSELRDALSAARLERAIGVIYRPETELASHYFRAVLPRQFDEYVWLDESRAVEPLDAEKLAGTPDTYPFGL